MVLALAGLVYADCCWLAARIPSQTPSADCPLAMAICGISTEE